MPSIDHLEARWILDSRGYPTVFCSIALDQDGKKAIGEAAVPSGASTGSHEALELRDGGTEFNGKGVTQAVHNINETIAEAIRFRAFQSAPELDQFLRELDGTENKSKLGANAVLAVSMAAHRAYAELFGLDLWQYLRRMYFSFLPARQKHPRLMMNILNGGQHADNPLDIQEFMIVPEPTDIVDALKIGSEIYHALKKALKASGQSTGVGDEGGFAPNLASTKAALEFIQESISLGGYSRQSVDIAMDAAATEFFHETTQMYHIDGQELSGKELTEYYAKLHSEFQILSIEDSHSEDDMQGWEDISKKLSSEMMLVGDDLFVTNINRFEAIGIRHSIANSILIKLNQIGTVQETCQLINIAKEKGYKTIVSHRSGETSDDFIADLAYASQADFLKAGAPARGERVAKYNRLLEIQSSIVE